MAENALTRFVSLLLAAQWPLQTSPITQPQVCYIPSPVPHASQVILHCPILSPPEKFAPSITGDINAQSSHKEYFLKFCISSDRNVQFYLRSASLYCVFLHLFQLPRHHYAKCQILIYKPIIFCQ